MEKWQTLLSEALIGCVTMPSQREYETCMYLLNSPYPICIRECVVDAAFEGYKNQLHHVVSCCSNFLTDEQKEAIKQSISIYLDQRKEWAKSKLRERNLLK